MGIATIPPKDADPTRAEARAESYAPQGDSDPLWAEAHVELYALSGGSLPHAVARALLDQHADRLPDLSGLTVLVPNHRAGQDFARVLAQAAGLPVLIPPRITPLKSWAQTVADERSEPQARRLARLHGVLRGLDWLGKIDKWALANELLQLADELSAARLGGDIGSQIRALHAGALDRETALIEAVWQALNTSGNDPQARYARALDTCLAQVRATTAADLWLRPGQAHRRRTAVSRPLYRARSGHAV